MGDGVGLGKEGVGGGGIGCGVLLVGGSQMMWGE